MNYQKNPDPPVLPEQGHAIPDERTTLDTALGLMCQELLAYPGLTPDDVQSMGFLLDCQFNIIRINQRAQQTLLYTNDELSGKPLPVFRENGLAGGLDALRSAPVTTDVLFVAKPCFIVPCHCLLAPVADRNAMVLTAIRSIGHDRETHEKLQHALHLVGRRLTQHDEPDRFSNTDDGRVITVTQNSRKAITGTVTVADLACEAIMSETKFKKIFKRIYGISVQQFITNALVDRARELMTDPEMPVKSIARSLNYTPQGFVSMFKKSTGQTPGVYRKRYGS